MAYLLAGDWPGFVKMRSSTVKGERHRRRCKMHLDLGGWMDRPVWLKMVFGVSVFCLTAATAFSAAPVASAHACGRVEGAKIHAYNLGCARARSIYGGQPPRGWTAANVDIAGGLAFYCRAADEGIVDEAIDSRTGRVRVGRLHGAPLIIAAVPYGE